MDLEALVVIGIFTLVLGAVLFALFRLWVRHKFHDHPTVGTKVRLTKAGVICVPVLVIVLIGGFLMEYIAPESVLGKLVETPIGRLSYAAAVTLAFLLIEVVLKSKGIRLIEKTDLKE